MNRILKKQRGQEDSLPRYKQHVGDKVVLLENNRVAFAVRLEGTPFEGVDDSSVVVRYLNLNKTLASLGKDKSSRLGLWLTYCRKKVDFEREYGFHTSFTRGFAHKYMEKLRRTDYFENIYYITCVLKYEDIDDALEEAEELLEKLTEHLQDYDPYVLKVYRNESGVLFSQFYEFIGMLANGTDGQIPLGTANAYRTIPTADLHFGAELLEMRCPDRTRYATLYDLKEFGQTKAKIMVNALKLPCEFVFTQSFTYIRPAKMMKQIDDQLNKLESVGDMAQSQHEEMLEAKGHLAAGDLMFGEYHGALVVFGETPKKAYSNGQTVAARFLSSGGFRFIRASLSAEFTFFSQFPGATVKPRPFPKATTNIAASFPMFNYEHGKSRGNPLGDGSAVMPLKTEGNTLYDFNFHYTAPNETVTQGEYPAGHTLLMGKTGTGKTTALAAMLAFAERFKPYIFAMDKDKGLEIFIRAIGGTYFPIDAGVPSGLNPFQWPDSPKLRDFLYDLVGSCVRRQNQDNTVEEQKQIQMAVDTVMNLDFQHRRMGALLHSVPPSAEDNSLFTRLEAWCGNGRFAWCLDNPQNRFNPDEFYRVGFDLTDILKAGYRPTEPILACMFYMKNIMLERVAESRGVLATVLDEFWLMAKYPTTQDFIIDGLKTDRKLGGFLILSSQSPKDAINSPVFDTVVEQTVTKVLLPNPAAEYEGNYRRLGLTEKEFAEMRSLGEKSRQFLVKQNLGSSIATLNLHKMDDEIAVLSGNAANVRIMHKAMERCGSGHPDEWLPVFHEMRKEAKAEQEKQQKQPQAV
ncbi:AAA-like domain protein [Neisseria musculi]|uniref:AAA-like domain protein n=1 Tax=Neisseria musculi TaxID=1815583 RepID=A0A7H1MEC6_9NEIS|nr:AAA-like domain protein [Neisseria musculi]